MSFAPEKKFIRWILSHLTIIIILSFAAYLFWNRAELGLGDSHSLENTPVETVLEKNSSDEAVNVDLANHSDLDNSLQETNPTALTSTLNDTNLASESPKADDFSERMDRYKKSLPVKEQKVMDKAEGLFQGKEVQNKEYQSKETQKNDTQQQDIEYSEDSSLSDLQGAFKYPSDIVLEDDIAESDVDTLLDNTATVAPLSTDVMLVEKSVATNKSIPTKKNIPIDENRTAEKVQPNRNEQVVKAKPKRWQQEIHNRQKQLQSEMVMLIPLEDINQKQTKRIVKNKKKQQSIKLIKPVINTPEQRILLNNARKAFDRKDFAQAEVAYKQVIKELPELPDVVGELASVYKAQNRTADYLATQTKFVHRLVNHNRFDEAWRVFRVTDSIDKTIAEQQRSIITEKQSQ